MRRSLLAACLALSATTILLGCKSDGGAGASNGGADAMQPTTTMQDHQPPPRTPEY